MPLHSGAQCGHYPMHRVTLRYDRKLIRQAVASFCWRVVGRRYVVALILVAAPLVVLVRGGNASWLVGVLASVLALGIAFPVAFYATHYRNALRRLVVAVLCCRHHDTALVRSLRRVAIRILLAAAAFEVPIRHLTARRP